VGGLASDPVQQILGIMVSAEVAERIERRQKATLAQGHVLQGVDASVQQPGACCPCVPGGGGVVERSKPLGVLPL
jgi:hypothetical protein